MSRIFHVQWKGTTAGGADIWMAGWHGQSDDSTQGVATLVAAKSTALFNARYSSITFGPVRVSRIVTATGVVDEVVETSFTAPSQVGTIQLPSEVALCVTLRPVAGLQTGRFYLPALNTSDVTLYGQLLGTTQTSICDKLQTFFQTDLGTATSPLRVGIYSRKDHNFVGASSLEIGNVFDSQRRRRNKLIESRLSRGLL